MNKVAVMLCGVVALWNTVMCNNERLVTECLVKHTDCLCAVPMQHIAFVPLYLTSSLVIDCMQNIEKQQSFKPLREVCQKLQECNDEQVTREFSILLIVSYVMVLRQTSTRDIATFLSIISLYAQLNSLPLEKLFDILEECWLQYQAILATFPKGDDELWSSWLQNYWWLPVVVVSFTAVQFLRWYRSYRASVARQELLQYLRLTMDSFMQLR